MDRPERRDPSHPPEVSRPSIAVIAAAAVGGAVAISVMETLSARADYPLAMVPFATSIVLVMSDPAAAAAQPRAIVGGHLLSTLVGLAVLKVAGPSSAAAAVSVGLAIAVMHWTRTLHPPAGIDPLVVVLNAMPATFLIAPVAAGAALLVAFAYLWHNVVGRRRWPESWR